MDCRASGGQSRTTALKRVLNSIKNPQAPLSVAAAALLTPRSLVIEPEITTKPRGRRRISAAEEGSDGTCCWAAGPSICAHPSIGAALLLERDRLYSRDRAACFDKSYFEKSLPGTSCTHDAPSWQVRDGSSSVQQHPGARHCNLRLPARYHHQQYNNGAETTPAARSVPAARL